MADTSNERNTGAVLWPGMGANSAPDTAADAGLLQAMLQAANVSLSGMNVAPDVQWETATLPAKHHVTDANDLSGMLTLFWQKPSSWLDISKDPNPMLKRRVGNAQDLGEGICMGQGLITVKDRNATVIDIQSGAPFGGNARGLGVVLSSALGGRETACKGR